VKKGDVIKMVLNLRKKTFLSFENLTKKIDLGIIENVMPVEDDVGYYLGVTTFQKGSKCTIRKFHHLAS
jgi:hypothetical protein